MQYETNDLGLAAFLLTKGFVLCDAYISSAGIYKFYFDDPDGKIRQSAIEFINSDCAKFDAQLRNLKKILRKKPGS